MESITVTPQKTTQIDKGQSENVQNMSGVTAEKTLIHKYELLLPLPSSALLMTSDLTDS